MKRVKKRKKFLVFGAPQIEEAEINEVVDSLKSGWLGTGPKVHRFEQQFARYKKIASNQVAAVNSCTAALHISLIAAGIGPGDEVITTPLTFAATINAIIHSGATPVLADIDPHTMNIDPDQIKAKINHKTKAILPVHFAGRPCMMDEIRFIAQKYGLYIIEDCAHAIETEYQGKKAGTFGDFGCFSFYVTKNVAAGEGGMIIAQDTKAIERAKILSLHGLSQDAWHRYSDAGYQHYFVVECGFKYNMMDLQAAIALHQLERVEHNWLKRQSVWQTYQQALSDLPLKLPLELEQNSRHAYHLYTIQIDAQKTGIDRDHFLTAMTAMNIGVGVHYLSIPEHPYYQKRFGWRPEDYFHAMQIGRQTVSLPLSAKITEEDVQDVIEAVRAVLK